MMNFLNGCLAIGESWERAGKRSAYACWSGGSWREVDVVIDINHE